MTFASVYLHYIKKIETKGRTKDELHQIIKWLTGFDDNQTNFKLPFGSQWLYFYACSHGIKFYKPSTLCILNNKIVKLNQNSG